MIEINLIPPNLRKKDSRNSGFFAVVNIPKEFIIGCGGIFVLVLGLVHLSLFSLWGVKSTQYAMTQAQWQQMSSDRNTVDNINKELKDVRAKITLITGNASKKAILWSQKLNILSDNLPKGVWFKKIVWNETTLVIEGSAYSKSRDEMATVGNFVSNLKRDVNFMKDFSSIELNSISRVKQGLLEVAVFTITVKVK